MRFTHYHKPQGETQEAEAIWPKMNVDNPPLFPGHVGQCECGVLMFWPADRALRPVEVEDKKVG